MNVKDLLEEKNITYQISGKDYVIRCLNEEHEDRNPSMRIDQVMGIFHCMSCDYKGNIFKLFDKEVNLLSQKREMIRRKISTIRGSMIGLTIPEDAIPYVGGWRDIKPETYRKFQAFKSHEPEYLGRIVFPITDITGKIVVFQGRDDTGTLKSKYYNFPRHVQLPMFPKVNAIKGSIILVEGLFDMLNLHDKGLDNAMTIFGANTFDTEKANLLKFQGATNVDIILDGDEAGQKGAEKLKEICESCGLTTRKVNLPEGTDPGGLSQREVETLRRQLYG